MGTSSSKVMQARNGSQQNAFPLTEELGATVSSDSSLTVKEVKPEITLPPMQRKERMEPSRSPSGTSDRN
eukprot:scaffold525055_cov46-Prasinocladus_malaysianus.AAC.1